MTTYEIQMTPFATALDTLEGDFRLVLQRPEVLQEPEDRLLGRTDVEPQLTQDSDGVYHLVLCNQGDYRQFSIPYVSSSVLHASDDLVVVVIGYHGTRSEKFGRSGYMVTAKGQFWRFYTRADDGIWERVTWPDLQDETRQVILDMPRPQWAKAPGKLRSQRAKPKRQVKMIAYKIVRSHDGHYSSVYGDDEYVLG